MKSHRQKIYPHIIVLYKAIKSLYLKTDEAKTKPQFSRSKKRSSYHMENLKRLYKKIHIHHKIFSPKSFNLQWKCSKETIKYIWRKRSSNQRENAES